MNLAKKCCEYWDKWSSIKKAFTVAILAQAIEPNARKTHAFWGDNPIITNKTKKNWLAKGITRWAREIHVEGENHERKSRGAWSFCILENQRLETGSFEQKGWWRPHRSTTPQGQQFVIISQWSDTGVCGAFATRSGRHGGIFNTPAWVQNKDNGKEAGQQRASLSLGLFCKALQSRCCLWLLVVLQGLPSAPLLTCEKGDSCGNYSC